MLSCSESLDVLFTIAILHLISTRSKSLPVSALETGCIELQTQAYFKPRVFAVFLSLGKRKFGKIFHPGVLV